MGRKRKLFKDTYALDMAFYKWLSERLPVYLKKASKNLFLLYLC